MAKSGDFDTFVKSQQPGGPVAAIDWDKQLNEWLNYLEGLYLQIGFFLKEYIDKNQMKISYRDLQLNEENIGSYTAREMLLRIGSQEIVFTPIGTLLIGMKGRVDVKGRAGTSRLFLINKKATSGHSLIKVTVNIVGRGKSPPPPPPLDINPEAIEWVWKIASPPPEMKFTELTREVLHEMILEVSNG